MTLTTDSPIQLLDLGSLRVDDEIQLRSAGSVLRSGRVLEIMPSLGVFWILDSTFGTRKLIDISEDSVWVLAQGIKAAPTQPVRTDVRRCRDLTLDG